MKNDIPHEHPLWPYFQEWCKNKVGSQSMLAVWWDCFLAGAAAFHDKQRCDVERRGRQIDMEEPS